jgi:Uma2 family endonuclease
MSTIAEPKTYSSDDLLAMPEGDRHELVDGHLVERNVSALSSLVSGRLFRAVANFCEDRSSAWVFGPDCGYRCFPGHPNTVRKPDVSLILRGRLPSEQLTEGFLTLVPDLAAEVISPHDLAYEVDGKVEEYLEAGGRLIWIVYPSTRKIHVHRLDRTTSVARSNDDLDGEDLLPGFRYRVGDLFAALPPAPTNA